MTSYEKLEKLPDYWASTTVPCQFNRVLSNKEPSPCFWRIFGKPLISLLSAVIGSCQNNMVNYLIQTALNNIVIIVVTIIPRTNMKISLLALLFSICWRVFSLICWKYFATSTGRSLSIDTRFESSPSSWDRPRCLVFNSSKATCRALRSWTISWVIASISSEAVLNFEIDCRILSPGIISFLAARFLRRE